MNVIIITLDCVRASHLGCYGYSGTDTPFIDRVAAEGVLFEQAFCQAPNTWISHASILTGCYPNVHGLRSHLSNLSPQVSTLAMMLQSAGYATAGFPAHSLVGSARGFQRGFDLFDEKDLLYDSTMVEGLKQHRAWPPTIEKASRWMLAQDRPFFLWLHYMGTHWEPPDSLSVPEDLRDRYSSLGQFYDAKIAHADQVCVGALLDFLSAHSLLDRTLIVITADHGEEDLSKNDPPFITSAHNNGLNELVMHVPLVIRAPGLAPVGTRVQSVVRLVDIVPTTLGLLGIDRTDLALDGVDLAPMWAYDGQSVPGLFAYMENARRGYAGVRTDEWKLVLRVGMPKTRPDDLFRRALRRAARTLREMMGRASVQAPAQSADEYPRYADWVKLGTEGFYAISDDPQERVNLSGDTKLADIESDLESYVLQMLRQEARGQVPLGPAEEEEIMHRLKALGYL